MNMHLDIDPTTANIIALILIVLLSACAIGIIILAFLCFAEITDFYSKKISKNIAKGNIYKAVMLYEKYNPLDFYYDNLKEDDFNEFVNAFYSYIKDRIDLGPLLLPHFLNRYTRFRSIPVYYDQDEELKKYLDKEIELMKSSIASAEDNKNWCPNDAEMANCLFILLLQDYGFVKFKDGKGADVCSLLAKGKYDEPFEIMDDCKLKDIIVNIKKYDECQARDNSCHYVWKGNEWYPIGW